MKRFIILVSMLAIFGLGFYGCGSDLNIDGKVYPTYGSLNRDSDKCENVQYKKIWGNIIWGFIAPIPLGLYFFGFSMYEPVGLKVQETSPLPQVPVTPEPVPAPEVAPQ
jgi:hypothetical protein